MLTDDQIRNAARLFQAELDRTAPAIGAVLSSPLCDCNGDGCDACGYTGVTQHRVRMCAGGCQLAAEEGDIFCQGCREGHERDRPLGRDW
jgi:hypothetical protein